MFGGEGEGSDERAFYEVTGAKMSAVEMILEYFGDRAVVDMTASFPLRWHRLYTCLRLGDPRRTAIRLLVNRTNVLQCVRPSSCALTFSMLEKKNALFTAFRRPRPCFAAQGTPNQPPVSKCKCAPSI